MQNFGNDLVIAKFKYLTPDLPLVVRGWGKHFDNVVLIYKHWAIMPHIEKLLDK